MSHSTDSKRASDRRAVWCGAVLSLSVGTVFYIATSSWIESDSRERFANHARNAQKTVDARIKSYTDVLRAATSLFSTSENLTREQFHAYVQGLDLQKNFPAIDTINYAVYVPHGARPAFERFMREEQARYPNLKLPAAIKAPYVHDSYSVVTFIEPAPPLPGAYGIDLQASGYVENSILGSRDRGYMMNSGTAIEAISSPNNIYLGMRLPVYRYGLPLDTVERRRQAYRGSVGIAFSIPRLVHGVLAEMPIRAVRMTVTDRPIPGPDMVPWANGMRILFDSAEIMDELPDEADPSRFTTTLPVDFNGRPWQLIFSTKKTELYTEFDAYYPKLASLAGFVASMLLYALLYTLTSSRRRALAMADGMTRELRESQSKLQVSHQNLRRLAAHADQIKETERKRIAREIHDDLGQNLLALRIEVDMLASRTGSVHPRLNARTRAMLSQIDATIKSVRQIINDLRPNVLDLGLPAAVEWQLAEFRRLTGIACELLDCPRDIDLSDERATAFFRILQESLSNITRHARASRVSVELKVVAGHLWMTISDNGVGFDDRARHKARSFGLVGIEERITMLGGKFSIVGMRGTGTTVYVSAPVDNAPPGEPAPMAAPAEAEVESSAQTA